MDARKKPRPEKCPAGIHTLTALNWRPYQHTRKRKRKNGSEQINKNWVFWCLDCNYEKRHNGRSRVGEPKLTRSW